MADASPTNFTNSWLPSGAWRHLVAGGFGGMCGAIATSPFDVVKTRLQSDLFQAKKVGATVGVVKAGMNGTAVVATPRMGGLLWHFVETGHIIRDIYLHESPRALFKGLGATLVGVIPARSINFFAYGNGKQIIANNLNHGKENALVHLSAAAIAGIITGTVTNPIWVVKTRLQLAVDAAQAEAQKRPGQSQTPIQTQKVVGGSVRMIRQIFREQGTKGFYKGLSASYLGVTEGAIQWVLYERLKLLTTKTEGQGVVATLMGILYSAGTAKAVASLITYPHEVLRTRLRQPTVNGVQKYKGLLQTLQLVIKEEGARSLYGGLSAHLMRVVPNAAVMFWIYESAKDWGRT